MQLSHYDAEADDSLTVFRFTSNGPRGPIVKLVQLSAIDLLARRINPGPAAGNEVYNLGFGDFEEGSTPDDKAVSDNGDREKVLATVAGLTYAFCQRYPWRWVYATGSTPARTRLYQMSLNRFHEDIVGDFELFGYSPSLKQWVVFEKNITYEAFLIRLK